MRNIYALLSGGTVATLGGLIGLGGAEFRLPILVGFFGFPTLAAVIMNKLVSLSVVIFSLIFRSYTISFTDLAPHLLIVINILLGSLIGAYLGANYALRIEERILNRMILILLVTLALIMLVGDHHIGASKPLIENGILLFIVAIGAGVIIGLVAALLGVAGGELIIPTLMILFGVDIKIAGSLSLMISLPTMLMAFRQYSKSDSFREVLKEKIFLLMMILGSVIGAAIGAIFLRAVDSYALTLLLSLILFLSAWKVFAHSHN
ncbi:MAG: sulfite exporter TauE/SafE family protein [Campylobacterales bacterium]